MAFATEFHPVYDAFSKDCRDGIFSTGLTVSIDYANEKATMV